MLSKYEIKYILLSEQYTPSRKLKLLNSLELPDEDQAIISEIKEEILDGKSEEEVLERLEKEESDHWAELYGHRAAADLLTIGKVQPETMLAMSALPTPDFVKAIKIATVTAKKLNEVTIEAEAELNNNLIPEELI